MPNSGWVPHGPDDYAQAIAGLLPQGRAWPRDLDSPLMGYVSGLATLWGDTFDPRAADLLTRESDPRATLELLDDWERAWGLPDPCYPDPQTISERQTFLVQRMTIEGGQSRAFFIGVALTLGYTITISEYAPFMVGVSEVGDTRPTGTPGEDFRWEIGAPEMRFYWTVHVGETRLTWFRTGNGGGQTGIDHHLEIGLADDLECVLRRWKPAHTEIVFDYSGLTAPGPMAGTP